MQAGTVMEYSRSSVNITVASDGQESGRDPMVRCILDTEQRISELNALCQTIDWSFIP